MSISSISTISLYADDLLLYRPLQHLDDYATIQSDISAIERWTTDSSLTLNAEKCKYMIISAKKSSDTLSKRKPLTLNDQTLYTAS